MVVLQFTFDKQRIFYCFLIHNYYYLLDNDQPKKVMTDELKQQMTMEFQEWLNSIDFSTEKPCK